MARCSCSTRALEFFIKDFAGVNLGPRYLTRAQRPLPIGRAFSSRSPFRQLTTSTPARSQNADNGYIPFESNITNDANAQNKIADDLKEIERDVRVENGGEEEGWHAEVEITLPEIRDEAMMNISQAISTNVGVSPSGLGLGDTVDSVRLRGHHAPLLKHHNRVPLIQVPQLPVDPSTKKISKAKREEKQEDEEDALPSTRAVSRMKRKLRRLAAGKWQPTVTVPLFEDDGHVEGQVETVLDKIEALDGPTTKPKSKTARAKPKESARSRIERKAAEKTASLPPKPKKEVWQVQKGALEHKFGQTGWQPRKRLSPDTLEGIRALHASDPTSYSTETLSEHFKVSPESIRRVLKSKWKPKDDEVEDRRARWERRGVKKWQDMSEKGMRAPAKWRAMGVGSSDGLKDDKIPKRRKNKEEEGLGWDEVVRDLEEPGGFAGRIL